MRYDPDKNVFVHGDYVYSRKLNLNLEEQKSTAIFMMDYVTETFGRSENRNKPQILINGKPLQKNIEGDPHDVFGPYTGQTTMTTRLYSKYNYLLYPHFGMHEYYNEIKKLFHDVNTDDNQEYYIQCWVNFYYKGDYINWHGHWPTEAQSWHGFLCIDVEPNSFTTYRIIDEDNREFDVPSENNLLVISRSGRDRHRSSEWDHQDRPRITSAFDIVPGWYLRKYKHYYAQNHWIPI